MSLTTTVRKIIAIKSLTNNSYKSENIYKVIKIAEGFVRINFFAVMKNTDDYVSGYVSKTRVVLAGIRQLANILTFLRFVLSALINNEWIREVMYDWALLFGQMFLGSAIYATLSLAMFALCITAYYKQLTHTLHFASIV